MKSHLFIVDLNFSVHDFFLCMFVVSAEKLIDLCKLVPYLAILLNFLFLRFFLVDFLGCLMDKYHVICK